MRFDSGTGVGQTGGNSHQYGRTYRFGESETVTGHFVSFLLVRRFEYRYKGKFTIYPGILLILRGMHRRIVGCGNYQSTVSSGNSCIHEAIGCHIHTDVFHTYQGSFAGVRHSQSRFHGRLFVGCPCPVYITGDSLFRILNIFGDFCRRSTGIGIYA